MNCREFAIDTLIKVLEQGSYNNISLRKLFKQNEYLSSQEKAFITELVNGTIRNLIFIDYIINQFSKVNTKKMKPLILNTLRISVYQISFMDNIPSSAICNEAVKIIKKKKFTNLAGFVNGVLRNIDRNKENFNLPSETDEPIKYLSILYSTPEWIINMWLKEFDFETVKKICESNLEAPKISICVNTNKTNKDELTRFLQQENVNVEDGVLSQNSLYISRTSDISNIKAFNQGLFHIMDESSMLSVEALGLKEGQTLIDVCSAPGGKTFYSSYLMKDKGEILARDIHKHKLNLIKTTVERIGSNIIKTQLLDATTEHKDYIETADCVLIDAPCSGLGILRKKPDIKYSKNIQDIENLVEVQRKILEACHKYVKKGGTLVYSTCTINSKENIENIKWFCEKYDYQMETTEEVFSEKFSKFDLNNSIKQGYIQILPYMYNTDGFFIAKMKRKG